LKARRWALFRDKDTIPRTNIPRNLRLKASSIPLMKQAPEKGLFGAEKETTAKKKGSKVLIRYNISHES
jgi:hypothetical protein